MLSMTVGNFECWQRIERLVAGLVVYCREKNSIHRYLLTAVADLGRQKYSAHLTVGKQKRPLQRIERSLAGLVVNSTKEMSGRGITSITGNYRLIGYQFAQIWAKIFGNFNRWQIKTYGTKDIQIAMDLGVHQYIS